MSDGRDQEAVRLHGGGLPRKCKAWTLFFHSVMKEGESLRFSIPADRKIVVRYLKTPARR